MSLSGFPVSYAEISRLTPRGVCRHAALTALAGLQSARGATPQHLRRPRVHFIYFHHCYPDEIAGFRALLSALSRDHDLVGYSEAVRRIQVGDVNRPCVALSFDDGVKNTLLAADVMREFGIKGCFFVCPAIVGETDPDTLRRFCHERLNFSPAEFLSWQDLERLLSEGHEVGGHTMTHARMSITPASELAEETGGCFQELRRRVGPVRHFAWPFGRFWDMSALAAEAVFMAGFETCASAERGCHVVQHSGALHQLCLRRETLLGAWPLSHSLYLLARSSSRAGLGDNHWPEALAPRN